ncbi:MAG TPA: N-acetylmuramoyl-L-alanine amidase [Candidatus Cloacimonetes bacterium]|nr:N-acetylmuramoyl-L-alanine amidase [Candidatus Cloacimonadota bacterium]HEX38062.1 N-acetylmuramoyl-L-alanine amidase [Candidatus Cloacimonadota bacterium]
MKHKLLIILLIIIFSSLALYAKEYAVSYLNSTRKDHLPIHKIDGKNYVNIYDIERTFDGSIEVDQITQTVELKIFDQLMTFSFFNNWVHFGKTSYNLHNDIEIIDGFFYVPEYFINLCANKFFPDAVILDNGSIIVHFASMEKYLIKTIVLDPGHGGKDSGAVGRHFGTYEKDIVLKITKKVKALLEQNLDVKVLLTRSDDRFVSLGDRTEFANEQHADIFVSIHCNAAYNTKANGSEVYYLSTAQTHEARAVEAMENEVIKFEDPESIKRYKDLDFILYDMRQTEYLNESSELSDMCQKELTRNLGTKDNGVRQANFYVLRGAFMPAILVEVAYLSNKNEEKKLRTDDFQNRAAKAIYVSLKQFKEKYDKMN